MGWLHPIAQRLLDSPGLLTVLTIRSLLLGVLLGLMAVSCKGGPLLAEVSVQPATISPNGDGRDDVAVVRYTVGGEVEVSIYLLDGQGGRHVYREGLLRSPLAGGYETGFNGVIQNRVLSDGDYTLVVEARARDGRTAEARFPLHIRDGDLEPLQISGLAVNPDVFTPNQDGYQDRVQIRARVNKPARVKAYLRGPQGATYPIPETQELPEPGLATWDYDAGIDFEVPPPPNGDYRVVVEATDRAGNVVTESLPLSIEDGGIPRANILDCDLEPQIVPLDGVLDFSALVRNEGTVGLRTTGPPSGTLYRSDQTMYAFEPETPGAFRLGLNYETNPGRPFPWRWQLGASHSLVARPMSDGTTQYYLPPGETVRVQGRVQIVHSLARDRVRFTIGLQHEDVRLVDFCDDVLITVGEAG